MAENMVPLISIGMPIFNSELTLIYSIEAIVNQSFRNFELIISDNCSTDSTGEICRRYEKIDKRITYIRQPCNIGPAANFKFVLDRAKGNYFMWAACDDIRTPDFLKENIDFLEKNNKYVASTSPNCMEGQEDNLDRIINFSITGDIEKRFEDFFKNCWVSHGIFYSVVRTEVMRKCDLVGQTFIAADWAIDLFLASHGCIHRTSKGLAIFGAHGVSNRGNPYQSLRNDRIELFLPFYRLSLYTMNLSANFSVGSKFKLMCILLKLNISAVYSQLYSALYQFYCANLKPLIKINR